MGHGCTSDSRIILEHKMRVLRHVINISINMSTDTSHNLIRVLTSPQYIIQDKINVQKETNPFSHTYSCTRVPSTREIKTKGHQDQCMSQSSCLRHSDPCLMVSTSISIHCRRVFQLFGTGHVSERTDWIHCASASGN